MNTTKKKDEADELLDNIHTYLHEQQEHLESLLNQDLYQGEEKEFLELAIDNLKDAQFNIRRIFESEEN